MHNFCIAADKLQPGFIRLLVCACGIIIGEHGDSEIAAFSSANVSGIALSEFCEMRGHFEHDENSRQIE